MNAYMNNKQLSKIFKQQPMATSVLLSLDEDKFESIKDKYNNSPIISSWKKNKRY